MASNSTFSHQVTCSFSDYYDYYYSVYDTVSGAETVKLMTAFEMETRLQCKSRLPFRIKDPMCWHTLASNGNPTLNSGLQGLFLEYEKNKHQNSRACLLKKAPRPGGVQAL